MRQERGVPVPEPNKSDDQLSIEVEGILEREIGRAEALIGIDALLEEGIPVRKYSDITGLMKPFMHEGCLFNDLFPPTPNPHPED